MKVESKKEFPLSQNIKEIPLFSFVRTDGQTDRQTDRRTERQTETDRQTHRQTDKHPQSCSENMPFGKPSIKGCLAAIKNL